MDITVVLKDCSALNDYEIDRMAALSSTGFDWGIGRLSKEKENWVLSAQAVVDDELQGFLFTSLERIGGTPALVVGVACVAGDAFDVLDALFQKQFFKVSMAFPDEDVLVCMKTPSSAPLTVLSGLNDLHPSGTVPNGEQRAWGRRLAKRYEAAGFDDKKMVASTGSDDLLFDFPVADDSSNNGFSLSHAENQFSIVWGWFMAEDLEELALVSC